MSSPGGTQAIDRAADVVRLVVEADEVQTFAELLEETGLPKSTLSRLVSALERQHLLERTSDGGFVAGALFALYAARHDPWAEVARLAQPMLEAVAVETGETANLGIPRGRTVVQIAQVNSSYLLGARDWLGVDVPPHCSALGKVLHAFDALELDGDLESVTPASLTSMAALQHDATRTRRNGFALTVDELEIGLTALAAPVLGGNGDVVAALGVSGSTSRLGDQVDQVGRLLVDQAEALSKLLRRRQRRNGTKEGAA